MARGLMNRRRFLALAGVGAAASAVPVTVGVKRLVGGDARPTIGVLVPAGRNPASGRSLVEGLRAGLAEPGADGRRVIPRLVTRPVIDGHGGAWAGARELLEVERADIVVGGVTAPVAHNMTALFEERQVPLLVANLGAHVVRPRHRHPQLLHHSLGHWQSSFALGRWAARSLGPRAHVVASVVDGGYDTLFAFRRGVESAGGEVVGTTVTGDGPSRGELAGAFRAIGRSRPDFVHAMFSGGAAVDFLRAYRASSVTRFTLTGTSSFVERDVLDRVGSLASGIGTASTWSPADRGVPRPEKVADAFAVLGYDAGRLIAAGRERLTQLGRTNGGLAAALSGQTVQGARGPMLVDGSANVVLPQVTIREVGTFRGGFAALPVMTADHVPAFPQALSEMDGGLFSSWMNEYLSP